jgi:hypothetical protein
MTVKAISRLVTGLICDPKRTHDMAHHLASEGLMAGRIKPLLD